MNQIIFNKNINSENHSDELISSPPIKKTKKTFHFFKWQFYFSVIIAIIAICIYIIFNFYLNQQEELSKDLAKSFSLSTLYSNTTNYSAQKTTIKETPVDPFVIGLIEIDKIKISYPILSETNNDLLKISPCRFAGPLPNEVGNLCIAGHNYVDYKFFSRINQLDSGDIIIIYDLSGSKINYIVSDKTEVAIDDLSCIDQNTNGEKIVTLITCNNVKGTRYVIRAKEQK